MEYSMYSLIDLFVFGAGIYSIYAWFQMKTKGVLDKRVLLGRDVYENRFRDKEGYIAYINTKFLIFGVIVTLSGAAGLFNEYVYNIGMFIYVIYVLLFAALIWFSIQSKKAIKKFYK